MIPGPICMHFEPALRRGCVAGLSAPSDCHGCPAYHNGEPYLGMAPADQVRSAAWDKARSAPIYAHVRGQR